MTHDGTEYLTTNVSAHLRMWAARTPARVAVRGSDGSEVTFGELERRVDAVAHGLLAMGFVPGDRACLFVPASAELILLTHAMLRAGIQPVLIDPGMGRKSLLSCVRRTAPRGLIGVPRAHLARALFPGAFRSVELSVIVGARFFGRAQPLARLERFGYRQGPFDFAAGGVESAEDEAAVLFTSGSTGPPKGVLYRHRNFLAQLTHLRRLLELEAGEVDVACFPLFALFDNALGMTSVFPDMDFSHPARCDPAKIVAAIESSRASTTFGSPAIWKRVAPWMQERDRRFSSLRRIAIAGAPVPPALIEELLELLGDGGDVVTPYGATEALPVSSIRGSELAGELRARIEGGYGTCVGRPAPGIEVALIEIGDEPISAWSESLRVPTGSPGEVCVRGDVVTTEYLGEDGATRAAKIPSADGLWHRMGDIGRLDLTGRLWLLGRKSHRIVTDHGTLFPLPTENIISTMEGVRRAALVGRGKRGHEEPVLVIEPEPRSDRAVLEARLHSHRTDLAPLAEVRGVRFKRSFPVDVRHNAKIRREDLKRWVESKPR